MVACGARAVVVETFRTTTDREAVPVAAGASAATTRASTVRSVATMRSPQHTVAGTTTVSRTTLQVLHPQSMREQQTGSTTLVTHTGAQVETRHGSQTVSQTGRQHGSQTAAQQTGS